MRFLVVLHLTIVAALALDPLRVHYIDRAEVGPGITNYLFRAGEPTTIVDGKQKFDMGNLTLAFEAAASAVNLTLPSDFFLLDISLLSIEVESTHAEKLFFDANPSAGKFHLWPFTGSLLDPNIFTDEERKILALYMDPHTIDDLPKKVPELRRMLYTSYNKSAILMIHCEQGMDRTGELSGSYYITYQNMSFGQALALDCSINPDQIRGIGCNNQDAFQWYCYRMYYQGLYKYSDACALPGAPVPNCTHFP